MSTPTPTPTPRTCSVCNGYNAPDRLPCPECQGCGLHDCRCSLDAALAATGDAPLTAEEFNQLDEDAGNNGDWETPFWKLRSAYLTLAAQLATARAERDALRERVDAANSVDGVSPDDAPEWVCELPAATAWREGVEHGQDMVLDALATPARPTDTTP